MSLIFLDPAGLPGSFSSFPSGLMWYGLYFLLYISLLYVNIFHTTEFHISISCILSKSVNFNIKIKFYFLNFYTLN